MTESNQRPEGLSTRGRALWNAVTSDYKLRPDDQIILEDACREIDLIDRLEEALVDAPLKAKGSMGQEVANPLITEIRQHRGMVATLLRQLKLPDLSNRPALSTSEKARMAANARWGNGGPK